MRREAAVSPDVFVFAGFRLEGASGELFRLEGAGNAVPVALGTRATALLRLLVEQHGKLVSKDTIMNVVWCGRIGGGSRRHRLTCPMWRHANSSWLRSAPQADRPAMRRRKSTGSNGPTAASAVQRVSGCCDAHMRSGRYSN